MSSEAQTTPEAHNADEQLVMEQERVDEERETSFQFQKQARDAPVQASNSALGEVGESLGDEALQTHSATEMATEGKEQGEAEAEAKAVEEATAAVKEETSSKPTRSGRKSRTSTDAPTASEEQVRKKSRRSNAPPSTSEAGLGTDVNVRLDRLRQALFRFLDLIEHRATRSSFAKALPHIDADSVEALRQQFVSQLKDAIIDESEKLIDSNDLQAKLASLHRLTQEADARYQAGYAENAPEIKDVWRKEIDLETAISAKAIPDQERRVDQLKLELDSVRKQNRAIHAALLETRARSTAIQRDATDSLDALESAIKGLEATPDMQKQLRQTMDDLLQDLGARV
ncbi:uncharacterized protein UMAG_12182 [Mycosarcoma maydis]|uniref:Uncharacterized protein n=1 Tax=Mycosarcoma maydis TaxID=5270 RepID=A0A0D1CST2_MYCMD|nr:uncharacterized protein UMAG_12182 [Ustilago maydis 521]KIS69563.1 hypothetical protein UMAG_12182 [Ustilago maydis 521]|eukprot:XP_011388911.1 hypothetical protein UMAG_12182 [Ustilago maydis 521]